MHGLVSLLPQPFYGQVEELWRELEVEHGLRGIRITPYPHFSCQIAREYDFDGLKAAMQEITGATRPLPIRTTGLGLFTGPRPVIFVQIVKDLALIEFHARIWELTRDLSRDCSPYYSPELWTPHISLAYEDVDRMNIAAVMARLAFRPFTWEMAIDNLALIYEPTGETGALHYSFRFG